MKHLIIACLLFLFSGIVSANNNLLIIGDSLSANYGFEKNLGWPALLQNRLTEKNYPYDVINLSISGDKTNHGRIRLVKALKQYQPKITIIELGANDGLIGLNIKDIKNNLQEMITKSKNAGSKILLLGLRLPANHGPQYARQFQQMYIDVAKENNILVVPLFLNTIDDDPTLMLPDQVHPRSNAQMQILNNIWPTLESML